MTTDADERKRIRHQVELMRAGLDALDIALAQDVPLGGDIAQNIAASAVTIAMTISRADAYRRAYRAHMVGVGHCETCRNLYDQRTGKCERCDR